MSAVKGKIKISELLHGCQPGRLQSIGWMQVIPLVSELSDDRFTSPAQALISTATYGTLVIKNPEDKPLIVPMGATYIVDQAAQNHALPHAGYVKSHETKKYMSAMCVQQTQGGVIKEGKHTLMLLPFPLKEKAHKVRREQSYGRLWPAITEFNSQAGISQRGHGGHLEHFFDHYKEQLDAFVAQFEPIPNQIGAIVLIGGKVVGVERMPGYDFFLSMWRPLIRECYGSLAILEANKAKGGQPPIPKTRVPIRSVKVITDLRAAIADANAEEYDKVRILVGNLINVELDRTKDEKIGEMDVEALGETPFVGQMLRDGEKVVYASLVAAEHWRQNEDWLMAKPFAMPKRPAAAKV